MDRALLVPSSLPSTTWKGGMPAMPIAWRPRFILNLPSEVKQ
jgi:hypothetical protein